MLSAIPLWLHIIAASVWVGSQIMMFAVVMPALRSLDSPTGRMALLRAVTSRFGRLGAAALAILVLSGIDNLVRQAPEDMFDYRYGYIMAVKLGLFVAILGLTLVHTTIVGPALMKQMQSAGDPAAAATMVKLRKRSVLVSVSTLLLSLGVLFCAALLRSGFAALAV